MALRIVRNDITKMNTEAIVNTANEQVLVGTGCDAAVYDAAGYDELLTFRKEKIGAVPEGEVFLTPGFRLQAKYIVHAVSPRFLGGSEAEEEKLRACYRKSLELAQKTGIRSISFPLISTGSYGYPKEEGLRIAVDEISAFLLMNEMDVYLVVFDEKSTELGKRIAPELKAYVDRNYVEERMSEYMPEAYANVSDEVVYEPQEKHRKRFFGRAFPKRIEENLYVREEASYSARAEESAKEAAFDEEHRKALKERLMHISDTFSEYLLYLIEAKKMENSEVWKRAIVDKKVFSKIKNDPEYHPKKLTALCLCVGAKLNLDETRDLLARAGYALSPSDETDLIFSYFIENQIYDMIELDILLEEFGLPCIIS